jgi:transposase
MLEKYP